MIDEFSPSRNPILVLQQPILLGSLSFAFLSFAIPIYGKSLGASALEIGGLFSIVGMVVVLLRPLVGWALDQWGRKLFFVVALVCYGGAMGLFTVASSIPDLYFARMVEGIGSAILGITAYTMATDLAPAYRRGEAVGYVNQATAQGQLVGGIAGFVLISFLAPEFGWQVVFAAYALLATLGAWLAWKKAPETRPVYPTPVVHKGTISSHLLKLLAVVLVTATSAAMISPIFLVFLQDRFTTNVGSLVLAFIPAGIVGSYLPSHLGKLSDRFGRARFMALGLVGSGLVSLLLPSMPNIVWLTILWTFASVGWAIAGPAEGAMMADLTGQQVRGQGYGLYTMAGSLGATIGPLVGGWLYDMAGHAVPFYLNAVVLCVGALIVLWLLKPTAPAITGAVSQ